MKLVQANVHFETIITTLNNQVIRTTKENYAKSTRDKEW